MKITSIVVTMAIAVVALMLPMQTMAQTATEEKSTADPIEKSGNTTTVSDTENASGKIDDSGNLIVDPALLELVKKAEKDFESLNDYEKDLVRIYREQSKATNKKKSK